MGTTVSSRPEIGAGLPPLAMRFRLGPEVLPEQAAFLGVHGFPVFEAVASADEIAEIDGVRVFRALQAARAASTKRATMQACPIPNAAVRSLSRSPA